MSDLPILARHARAMGSAIEVQIALAHPDQAPAAKAALEAALAWIADAEARLSRFIPTSELCALNRAAGSPFHASPDLFAIVSTALAWADRTNGLFNPTMLATITALGYRDSFVAPPAGPLSSFAGVGENDQGKREEENDQGKREEENDQGKREEENDQGAGEEELTRQTSERTKCLKMLPQAAKSPSPAPLGRGWGGAVALDPIHQTITLPTGMGVDLGGIGKGWAADQVLAQVLSDFPHALVNIGGDLAVRGGPTPQGWIIGVRDPRYEGATEPRYLGGMLLCAGGIATSGAAWRWWQINGQKLHHLIDPRTHQPATTIAVAATSHLPMAVTALAHSATEAEVRAKEALLLGPTAGLARLAETSDRAGLFIYGDGRMLTSRNLAAYLAANSGKDGA